MENVEDVIPVSSDEGFESDLKKKTKQKKPKHYVHMCNKYCKKKKKRQFFTCHIVYMVGVV